MDILRRIWNLRAPYISQEGAAKLKGFNYHGTDNSYVYRYIWSPLAEWATGFLPPWVAYDVDETLE
jgi:hypothetical protein